MTEVLLVKKLSLPYMVKIIQTYCRECVYVLTGYMQGTPCQGKRREFGNFAKQGILFAQVVNFLILKVFPYKDISIFAVKIYNFF